MIDAAIRAVFFDAVGTLLFPRDPVARTYAEFARRTGIQVNEDEVSLAFHRAFARQETVDLQAGWRTNEERERHRWQSIVAEVLPGAKGSFDELWARFATPAAWSVNPEAGEVLRQLSDRGLVVGIASNFDSRLIGLVDAISELRPLRGRCAVSSLIGWRKPAREFFRHVAQLAGCVADQILHVGDDTANDVEGATAAGLKAVLYDPDGRSTVLPRISRLRDLLPP
jgi:putative hydrolase of the HAD superfamily